MQKLNRLMGVILYMSVLIVSCAGDKTKQDIISAHPTPSLMIGGS